MSAHWKQIETLFDAALNQPPDERAAWLGAHCADDPLRAEVEALLAAHARPDGVLDRAPPRLQPNGKAAEGQRVGAYRLVREIGHGGMGTVYLARRADGAFDHEVAVKILQPGRNAEERRRRFHAERQILASLRHPNIASLYDGGVTGSNDGRGRPYFVMEHVAGCPLDAYCDEERLSVEARLRLFATVGRAVQHAHQNLVVHRDLKSSNVLVTPEGQVKLLDFGIAKLLSDDVRAGGVRTRTGRHPMTPACASPEQMRGGPITTASDVYQLGLLLYELLAGRRPYRLAGRSPSEVERVICETMPAPPSTAVTQPLSEENEAASTQALSRARAVQPEQLRNTLRGDLDQIVLKALRKEPERRYASAAALVDDVERHLRNEPVAARPATLGYRMRAFVRRHRWGVGVSVLVALLLVGYAATVTVQARRIAAERDRAQIEAIKTAHVKDFMIALFGQTAPGAPGRDTATVGEVLDGGTGRIRRDLAGHPEIRAEMMSALASVYQRLGRYDDARPLFEEALAARRSFLGNGHADVAASLSDLAALEQHAGRSARAGVFYREALALQRTLHDEDALAVAEAKYHLADLLRETGDTGEAARLYTEALPAYRRLGHGHGQTATLMTRLAALRCAGDDYEAGAALYREALQLRRARTGDAAARVDAPRRDAAACRSVLLSEAP